jgi:hypothetical protein
MYHMMRISFLIAAVVGGLSPSSAGDPTPKLVTEHFKIDASDPGIKLYIRNKRPEEMTEFKSDKTLLFVHGASQPAEGTFDLPLEGCRGWITSPDVAGTSISWMFGAMELPPGRRRWINRPQTIRQSPRLM